MSTRLTVPFEYHTKEEFPTKLVDWIGQVFYDILPEQGYEIREEQVYTAFQLAEAVCNKRIHLAEAGLGTGKTFAYLLTAIAYARFSRKPVVIACASIALLEQLAGSKGDIEKLSEVLKLEIDSRMAKDPRQYICDTKINEFGELFDSSPGSDELNQWLEKTEYGERSEMPLIPDRVWKEISWEESMSCDECSMSGFCKLVKAREYYRPAKDLIVTDHGLFFEDLWNRDQRIAEGKLPILPDYSLVIFDEGHKVILPAVTRAGQQINQEDIDNIILALEQSQGARESLISSIFTLERASSSFFDLLNKSLIKDQQSPRLGVKLDAKLLEAAGNLHKALDHLLFELQIERELYIESLPESTIASCEIKIERAILALARLKRNESKDVLCWVDQLDGTLWVVPRNLRELLDRHLFQKRLPVVFTSATLSNEGDFSYFSRSLGLKEPSSSTVGSPFDIEEQVVVYLSKLESNSSTGQDFSSRIEQLVSLLKSNRGRALVLTKSLDEIRQMRKALKDYSLPFEVLWEDRGERGYLVRRFREEESSVLIGASFWEGIDIPGEALTLVVVWELPFPSLDPLIELRRNEAEEEGLDPKVNVDYPEMGLKLKQGCGRLIRSESDRGAIAIMDPVIETPWEKVVLGALPAGAKCVFHIPSD